MSDSQQTLPLSAVEREPLDEITAAIAEFTARRTGMILMLGRIKGITNSTLDYRDGSLIATPSGETK